MNNKLKTPLRMFFMRVNVVFSKNNLLDIYDGTRRLYPKRKIAGYY